MSANFTINKAIGYGIDKVSESDQRFDFSAPKAHKITHDKFRDYRMNQCESQSEKIIVNLESNEMYINGSINLADNIIKPCEKFGNNFVLITIPELKNQHRFDDMIDDFECRFIYKNLDKKIFYLKENIKCDLNNDKGELPNTILDLINYSGLVKDESVIKEFKPMIATWWS